jgi:hypothetical protein
VAWMPFRTLMVEYINKGIFKERSDELSSAEGEGFVTVCTLFQYFNSFPLLVAVAETNTNRCIHCFLFRVLECLNAILAACL